MEEKRIEIEKIQNFLHGDKVRINKENIKEINDESIILGLDSYKNRNLVVSAVIEENKLFFVPLDRRFAKFSYETKNLEFYRGKKFLIYVISRNSCLVIKFVGKSTKYSSEVNSVLQNFSIDYFRFNEDISYVDIEYFSPSEIIKEELNFIKNSSDSLKNLKNTFSIGINQSIFSNCSKHSLLDLTEKIVFSIDPPNCTDIDDALHIEEFTDFYEIGIHIADVTSYVKENTEIDKKAKNRAVSVYLKECRIDMLPLLLSTEVCSLKEKKISRSFSVIFKVEKDSRKVVDACYRKCLIENKKAMTYEEAQEILESKKELLSGEKRKFFDKLTVLKDISKSLNAERIKNGALRLNLGIEEEFDENKEEVFDTHNLIEEFMLLANVFVSKKIYSYNKSYSLLRKHPKPGQIKIEGLSTGDLKTGKEINSFIEKHSGIPCIKSLITKNLQQAFYFASGTEKDFSHFGLAAEIYTHFTSPIRRYADVLVHRCLNLIVEYELFNEDFRDFCNKIDSLSTEINPKTCNWINFRHRNAQNISRMLNELYVAVKLTENPSETFKAVSLGNNSQIYIEELNVNAILLDSKQTEMYKEILVQFAGNYETFCIERKLYFKLQNQ